MHSSRTRPHSSSFAFLYTVLAHGRILAASHSCTQFSHTVASHSCTRFLHTVINCKQSKIQILNFPRPKTNYQHPKYPPHCPPRHPPHYCPSHLHFRDQSNPECCWLEAQARGVQLAIHLTWYAPCQYSCSQPARCNISHLHSKIDSSSAVKSRLVLP